MKKYIILFIIIVIIGSVLLIKNNRRQKDTVETEKYKRSVKAYIVKTGDIELKKEFFGKIISEEQTEIYPSVMGKFIKYNVKEGEYVQKDKIIAEIDRAIPGMTFENAKIKTPINGIVYDLTFLKGQPVVPQRPIAMIANPEKLMVRINTSGKILKQIKNTSKVQIYVDDTIYTGEIIRKSFLPNNIMQTGSIDIKLNSRDSKLINTPCNVYIVTDFIKNAIRIPITSVKIYEDKYYVYKIIDNKVKKTKIDITLMGDDFIAVKSGINEGDTIVAIGVDILQDNEPIIIK